MPQTRTIIQEEDDLPPSCECDNTHENNDTVCRFCWSHGRRKWDDPYTFAALTDAAKEKARRWYRDEVLTQCWNEHDYSCVIEDFVQIAEIIGITFDTHEVKLMGGGVRHDPNIWWSGFCSQGDGACFEGSYRHNGDSCAKIREYCSDPELLRVTDELARIQAAQTLLGEPPITATMTQTSSHYSHEHTVETMCQCVNAREGEDIGVVADTEETIAELMRDLMRWLYRQLDQQNDWLYSDENVDERIAANEYMFDEEGNRHDYA